MLLEYTEKMIERKLAVTQPYFFPYLGFFQLINLVDFIVILDVVQFKKRNWMCRNRIIHPDESKDFLYISLPIRKPSYLKKIKEVYIVDDCCWKEEILRKINAIYRKSPFFKEIYEVLLECFNIRSNKYLDVVIHTLKVVCSYLDISWKFSFLSKMDLQLPKIEGPGDWSLYIAKKLGFNIYINLPKGIYIYDNEKFKRNGIFLYFLYPKLQKYFQLKKRFISHLSIIDVMMMNHKDKVKDMIKNDFVLLTSKELLDNINKGTINL